jgi:hypothetical protein
MLRKNLEVLLILLTVIQFSWSGIYKERLIIEDKETAPVTQPIDEARDRKLILVFMDALREDLVEFDSHGA